MQLIIGEKDFQRLSPEVQDQLWAAFSGQAASERREEATQGLRWRQPVDLTREQALRLVHGLSKDHRRRLKLFARKGGRVRMKEILSLTGETDLRSTSQFNSAMTRRLRRVIADPDKKAQLVAWDFDCTKWDANRTTIVDGVYYVSEPTAESLRACFGSGPKKKRA